MSTTGNFQLQAINNLLHAGAQALNPAALSMYGPDGLHLWSEGGEWPAYKPEYELAKFKEPIRRIEDVEYRDVTAQRDIAAIVKTMLLTDGMAGISMDCGAGKSTKVVKQIHSSKMYRRTLVIEPSCSTAAALAKYTQTTFVQSADELPEGQLIVYMSGGAFLDVLLRTTLRPDDLVIIDEAHCASFVFTIIQELLLRMSTAVLFMTASTKPVVKAAPGTTIDRLPFDSPAVAEVIAKTNDKSKIVVGVLPNETYGFSANALVGQTCDVKLVVDSGLRADPLICNGKLMYGERVAQVTEVLQMAGRLGRTGSNGRFIYDPAPVAAVARYPHLYDVLSRSICGAIGVDVAIDRDAAIASWKDGGLISVKPATTDVSDGDSEPMVDTAPEAAYFTPPDSRRNSSEAASLIEGAKFSHPNGCAIVYEKPIKGSQSGDFIGMVECSLPTEWVVVLHAAGRDCWRHEKYPERYCVTSSNLQFLQSKGMKVVSASGDAISPPAYSTVASDSSSAEAEYKTRIGFHILRKGGPTNGSVRMATSLIDRGTGDILRGMDKIKGPKWRPFQQGPEVKTEVSKKQLGHFVERLTTVVIKRDKFYPDEFPLINRNDMTERDITNTRDVLAGIRFAEYSETEAMVVLFLWNEQVRALRGRSMSLPKAEQFAGYIREYLNFNVAA